MKRFLPFMFAIMAAVSAQAQTPPNKPAAAGDDQCRSRSDPLLVAHERRRRPDRRALRSVADLRGARNRRRPGRPRRVAPRHRSRGHGAIRGGRRQPSGRSAHRQPALLPVSVHRSASSTPTPSARTSRFRTPSFTTGSTAGSRRTRRCRGAISRTCCRPQDVRVASMVPADATDIRDASGESFALVDSLGLRAGVLEIVAITCVALGVADAALRARPAGAARATAHAGRRAAASDPAASSARRSAN